MKILLWLLTLAAGGYGALGTLMYFGQRSLLYFPEEGHTEPAAAGFAAAEEVVLDTSDGEQVIVWHRPPQAGKRAAFFFTGTAGGRGFRARAPWAGEPGRPGGGAPAAPGAGARPGPPAREGACTQA